MVPIDADDLAAHAGSDLAKLTLLVRRRLLGGRGPKIENSALHRSTSPFCYRREYHNPYAKFGVQNGAFCWFFDNTIRGVFFVQFLHGTDVRVRSKADIARWSRACR